jgi:hypothetical protein
MLTVENMKMIKHYQAYDLSKEVINKCVCVVCCETLKQLHNIA